MTASKIIRARKTSTVAAAALALGLLAAPAAAADEATGATVGEQAQLVDGNVIQSWTVTGLKPSSDSVPFTPRGTLWEATATNEAVQGSVQPIVSNLNARAANGDNYRVLFGLATPQGINPAPLDQGEKTTGKVYFDVTGASPDQIVYNAGGQDLLIWNPAPAVTPGAGGQSAPASGGGTYSASAPAATTPAPAAAPAAAGSQGTPLPAGSVGTPLPTGSQGTPLPAGGATTPAPAAGSQGTPVYEGTPATGSQGTPLPEGTPATPAPAAPAATGSQGTPVPATAPTPTVAPTASGATPAS
ncbi:MAG TPA: DUF1942 domain-containing protein [Mycobacterium sp.]|nr:DUF1942 domain-containing protein [Mycobacterium sp.]